MTFELEPRTEVGARVVALAEEHAVAAAGRADEHDRAGTFPHETFAEMQASGFLNAPIPEEFGGMGLRSVHDLAVALGRLARADGSTAIAANMHLTFCLVASRMLRGAREAGAADAEEAFGAFVGILGSGTIAMANATEPGTDFRHPLVEATPVEGGYRVNGRKIFGTLSPIAHLFWVPCRVRRDDGSFATGAAIVFRGSEGQRIADNWDALGMRASGSNDVVYDDCFVPERLFIPGESAWGEESPMGIVVGSAGNLGLVSSFLGIAEAAHRTVVGLAKTRTKAPSGRPIAERRGIQHAIAESEVDLVTMRALIAHAGTLLDDHVMDRPVADVPMHDLHELMREFQCVKLVVNRKAIEVVDRALSVSGGLGYLNSSPLSRLYRDVRAGPFMQPYSPIEAHEYIGKVALGLPPNLDV